jgi:predicted TIM-barrel fold metal-dependent hydrolase
MIVDAHTHLGEIGAFRTVDLGVEAMLSTMDLLGIDACIQMHTAGLGPFEEAYGASEAAYERSGGRLPYCMFYNPLYQAESLAWVARCLERPGGVGIKIHPSWNQIFPEDARFEPAWQMAADHQVPIITHSWALSDYNPAQQYSTPEHFEHFVACYPQVNLILGHAGGRYEGHRAAADLARRYPNVYMDISGDGYSFGLIEWLVEHAGADRILFGSDVNWIDQRTHLGRVLDADITLEQKRLILGENACRLFRKLRL